MTCEPIEKVIHTCLEYFCVGEHTFLQTCVQEVYVVPEELVHCNDFSNFSLKISPVGLQHLHRRVTYYLLDHSKHPRAEEPHAAPPCLELGMPWYSGLPHIRFLIDPDLRQTLFDMLQVCEETEE